MKSQSFLFFYVFCLCFATLLAAETVTIRIGSPVNVTKTATAGKKLGECGFPDSVFTYHLFESEKDPLKSTEYNKESIINEDIDLIPYYKMTVKGEMKEIFYSFSLGISGLSAKKQLGK